jgi:hypothetical protein
MNIRQFADSNKWDIDFKLHFIINGEEITTYHVGSGVSNHGRNKLYENEKSNIYVESFKYEEKKDA